MPTPDDPPAALDEGEEFPQAALSEAPTAPMAGGIGEPPVVDVASEMTSRIVTAPHDKPVA